MPRFRHGIMEVVVDPYLLDKYPQEGLTEFYDSVNNSDTIEQIKDQIKQELRLLIDKHLTIRQKQIMALHLEGKTQEEIARELGIIQECVCLSLYGIPIYSGNKKTGHLDGKKYGGIINKLKKLSNKNTKIQQLLKEIKALKGAT